MVALSEPGVVTVDEMDEAAGGGARLSLRPMDFAHRAPAARRNGGISHWYAEIGIPPTAPPDRAPLEGDRRADFCIAGAGYTGLWTAYYLSRAFPEAEIVVLEREFAGFGASGRNGGWVSDHFAGVRERMARSHGRDAVIAIQRGLQHTIDEILSVCREEEIDADLVKEGVLMVARSAAQEARMHETLAEERAWDQGPQDIMALSASELEERLRISGARAALFSPHCARAQPAKLVTGLARAVQRRGVRICENTTVLALEPGRAVTDRGTVSAPVVLRCLEGFTPSVAGAERDLLPLNSAIVVTDPLGEERWARIGWEREAVLGDLAHAYMYAQRTADGRIALGGRGVPYRFGSRTDRYGETQAATIRQLTGILHAMFPDTLDVPIDHAWCGVLGVRRDWTPTVRFDGSSGLGDAGGYVGSGVSTANLAARVLVALVAGSDGRGDGSGEEAALTQLPWVRDRARRWEPEPLRWLGARLVYGLYRTADQRESASDSPDTDPLAKLAGLISGR
jgi:glycine/D-amino acid oxidase-like deaminating enzyme